ncbi:MAG: cytochrome ubiquinol oxidase subunit I [Thaumarchaeota archaeon]|nr:cytochrome ubiquinol oxidase subunit I [Nitrososphaerota archaeon]
MVDAISMVLFDKFLFAFTIASHIVFVAMSISLIVVISVAEFISIRNNDKYYEILAKRLTKVFVISFGVGTASGIVMAVELVTLFPVFMTFAAQTGVIALFYAEVFAFFLEIIALVLYVYYADYFRSRYSHWLLSVFIALGTLMSALFITMVNAWMNTPNGFDQSAFLQNGVVSGINPWAPFLTVSTIGEIAHVVVTTLLAGSMLVAGYFAWRYIKTASSEEKKMLVKGLKLTAALGISMIIFSGLTGSHEISMLLQYQPLKYAAVELNPFPGANLPEKLFGALISGQVVGAISIPGLQSLLASLETQITTLPGLSQFPSSDWPPLVVHTTFDIMVIGGMLLGLFFLLYFVGWAFFKKRPYESQLVLFAQVALSFLALLVFELGWMTDELGRQPWIVYNVMTVDAAANYTSTLLIPGILIIAFYVLIIPVTFYFFSRVFNSESIEKEEQREETISRGVNY